MNLRTLCARRGIVAVMRSVGRAIGLVCALATTRAHSEGVQPATADDNHGFVNIQRFDATSRVGVDLTYFVLDPDLEANAMFLRYDPHLQVFDPTSRAGGYLQVPITSLIGDSDTISALGDLEIGGFYMPRLSSPNLAIVVHGGLVLPTARDHEYFRDALSGFLRPHDFYQTIPQGTSIRAGVSTLVREGLLIARVDAGIDDNVHSGLDAEYDPAVHLNVGLGVDLGDASLAAELSALNHFTEGIDLLAVSALSARLRTRYVQAYGALLVPLSSQVRDSIYLGLTIGIEGQR